MNHVEIKRGPQLAKAMNEANERIARNKKQKAIGEVQTSATRMAYARNNIKRGREPRMFLYELVKHYNVSSKGTSKVNAKHPADRMYGLLGLANHNDPVWRDFK